MTQYPNRGFLMLLHKGRRDRETDGTETRVFHKWFLEAEWVWVTEQLAEELKEGKGGIAQ